MSCIKVASPSTFEYFLFFFFSVSLTWEVPDIQHHFLLVPFLDGPVPDVNASSGLLGVHLGTLELHQLLDKSRLPAARVPHHDQLRPVVRHRLLQPLLQKPGTPWGKDSHNLSTINTNEINTVSEPDLDSLIIPNGKFIWAWFQAHGNTTTGQHTHKSYDNDGQTSSYIK